MLINKKILDEAVAETMLANGGRKVTIYSNDSLRVLRYFEIATPNFSKGIAAASVLEDELKRIYPDEWSAVIKLVEPNRRDSRKAQLPEIDDIDLNIMCEVEAEISIRDGRLVTTYNPQVAAVLRYLLKTQSRFSMSKTAAGLLESGLKRMYPVFFDGCDSVVDECKHPDETRVVKVNEHRFENVYTCVNCGNERIVNDRRIGGSRVVEDDVIV